MWDNILRSFELSNMCKATSVLIQSCVWIEAGSRPAFFATFRVRGGHGIRDCQWGSGDCRYGGRKLLAECINFLFRIFEISFDNGDQFTKRFSEVRFRRGPA